MSLWQEIYHGIGKRINGVQFNIDLAGKCCLLCPSCAVGSIGGQTGKNMSIDLFKRIMDKAQKETKVKRVQLYIFTDPFLHKDLHLFVQDLTDRGIESTLSTMLQTTKADFAKVIEARPTEFRVSFPGWDHMEYYQKNAKPELFDRKFQEIVFLPRYPETKWNLIFHRYNNNKHELPRAKKLARDYDFHFVELPAINMDCEAVVRGTYNEIGTELNKHLLETPEESISRMKLSPDFCQLWWQTSIDSDGMVRLCQLVYSKEFKLVPYLDYPIQEIRRMVRGNSFCNTCMAKGGNVYQECYSDMVKYSDPISAADKKRRLSGVNEALKSQ